jgi:hypothetical protein
MCISTLFSNPKVANYVGQMLVLLPVIIFFQFASVTDNGKYAIYLFFFFPQVPSSCLVSKLITDPEFAGSNYLLVDISWVSTFACWTALILMIPGWLALYTYLDSVMPNTYGVQRHPCFCLQRRRRDSYHGYSAVADSDQS